MSQFEIPLVSLIFIILLNIIYFSRKRMSLVENKLYEVILICSLVMALIDVIIHLVCSFNSFDIVLKYYYNFFNMGNTIASILFVIIFSSLFCYTVLITYPKVKNNIKMIMLPWRLLFLFLVLL